MQLSGFYTLIHICLQNLEEGMSLEENWKELKKYFVGIGENSSEDFGKCKLCCVVSLMLVFTVGLFLSFCSDGFDRVSASKEKGDEFS